MTWDIFVFDFRGELPDRDLFFSKNFIPPLMGSVDRIRNSLDSVWPGFVSNKEGYYYDDFCVMKVDIFKSGNQVACIRLRPGYERIYGKMPNPYRAIQNLCMAYDWSAYDQEINCFLNFPNPCESGLKMVRQRAASLKRRTRDIKRELNRSRNVLE